MFKPTLLRPWRDSLFVRWLAVVVWMACIFAFSAQPQLPSLSEPFLDVLFKKIAHFCVYGVLAFLLFAALGAGPRAYWQAWLLAVLYACSDEWHQSFVPGRHPSAWDVLIDGVGAAFALLLVHHRGRWWSVRPPQ